MSLITAVEDLYLGDVVGSIFSALIWGGFLGFLACLCGFYGIVRE